MVRLRYLLLAALVITCGILSYHVVFPGEQDRIREQVENLRAMVSKEADESESAAGLRAGTIRRMFAAPCRIEAGVYDICRSYASDEIAASIFAARQPYRRIDIGIYDVHIAEIGNMTAEVRLTASVDLTPYGGASMNDTHEIVCHLEKNADDWRFSEIRTVDVLER